MTRPRWPVGPALRAWSLPVGDLATAAGVSKATLYSGTLSDDQADRVAIAIGVHPFDLWPDWFDVLVAS